MRAIVAAAGLAAIAMGGTAQALVIGQTANVDAGMAAFGPAETLFDWSRQFPETVWTTGNYAPAFNRTSLTDPVSGGTVSGNLSIANWWDGAGFDRPGGGAGADLALNARESFSVSLALATRRIGFALTTGLGNAPSEVNHNGYSATITTDTGEMASFTLTDPGEGAVAWIVIDSDTPFTGFSINEVDGDIYDQYFGQFLSAASPVPEPKGWATMLLGFGLIGGLARRRVAARQSKWTAV